MFVHIRDFFSNILCELFANCNYRGSICIQKFELLYIIYISHNYNCSPICKTLHSGYRYAELLCLYYVTCDSPQEVISAIKQICIVFGKLRMGRCALKFLQRHIITIMFKLSYGIPNTSLPILYARNSCKFIHAYDYVCIVINRPFKQGVDVGR